MAFDAKNIGRATRFYAFSFHPGLRRMSDYHQYLRPVQAFFQEDYINTWLFWHGFYMVWTCYCRSLHIILHPCRPLSVSCACWRVLFRHADDVCR